MSTMVSLAFDLQLQFPFFSIQKCQLVKCPYAFQVPLCTLATWGRTPADNLFHGRFTCGSDLRLLACMMMNSPSGTMSDVQ